MSAAGDMGPPHGLGRAFGNLSPRSHPAAEMAKGPTVVDEITKEIKSNFPEITKEFNGALASLKIVFDSDSDLNTDAAHVSTPRKALASLKSIFDSDSDTVLSTSHT